MLRDEARVKALKRAQTSVKHMKHLWMRSWHSIVVDTHGIPEKAVGGGQEHESKTGNASTAQLLLT